MTVVEIMPSGVGRRIAAYFLDFLLLFTVLIPLQGVVSLLGHGFPYRLLTTGACIEVWIVLSVSLPVWLYFAFSESSSRQATFGKRLFGLKVIHLDGNRIGFGQALLRTIIKLIPWELTHLSLMLPIPLWWDPHPGFRLGMVMVYILLGIYLAAMFVNKRRQSIHDLIAQTMVVDYLQKKKAP
jgi:uncharacterized RDD family membrane protein YckC